MTTSIGKLSKSFLVKILVGIIILPFVFWGMGDVFRGGNQNIVATIDSKKISTKEFIQYVNRLNLNEQQIKDLRNTDLIEKILSEFIGKKVMDLEIKRSGIKVNDNSLRDIIKNDELFLKNNEFSRTKYEKFLIQSGITAPTFEQNIAKQESKRQFLDFLSSGFTIPEALVQNAFIKENQIKTIRYIDLNPLYQNKKLSEERIDKIYNNNKDSFVKEYKSIRYAKITPKEITGKNEFDEEFFKRLDILENNVLDGQSFEDAIGENNLKAVNLEKIDSKKKQKNKNIINNLPDKLFKKIFNIKQKNTPEVLKIENDYFLAEIVQVEKSIRPKSDPEVLKIIKAQLNFQNKIESNNSIVKDISLGAFNNTKMESFAAENNLELKNYTISSLKQNDIFSEGIIKRIFLTKDGDVDLITNSTLTKSFLVLAVETKKKKLNKSSEKFERYEAVARLNLINQIYKIYDKSLNDKYKVELNKRTIDRVKNSF